MSKQLPVTITLEPRLQERAGHLVATGKARSMLGLDRGEQDPRRRR